MAIPGQGLRKVTQKGDPIEIPFALDRHRGIVKFERPVYQGVTTKSEAEVYLEVAFSIRDRLTRQFVSYMPETLVDRNGFGYHTFSEPSLHARSVITYNDDHEVIAITRNRAELDRHHEALMAAAAGEYTYEQRNMTWFNQPNVFIRLDGRTTQIRHVITDGTDGEPGHYSIMSQSMDFDQFVRGSGDRIRATFVKARSKTFLSGEVLKTRNAKAND